MNVTRNTKKICFVTTGDIKNIATSKRALGMADTLYQLGWEVHIIMEDTVENRKRAELECSKAIKFHYFSPSSAWNEVKSKNKIIKNIQPDFVYICAFVFRNIVHTSKSVIRLVEHSELQSSIPDIKGLKKLSVHLLENYSVFYSNGLLCASKYLYDYYQRKSNRLKRNLPILYFPYAYSEKVCRIKSDNELSPKYTGLKDKFNIVFLGSLTENYGLYTMLDAIKRLSTSHQNIRLILLGRGRHFQQAEEFVQEHHFQNVILMPGYVEEEEITDYFSIADAFLSPMHDTIQDWARCPSKLYMYLPYKKPLIACKIGEPYEVLGTNGFYYESGSANDLAKVIGNCISNENYHAVNPQMHTWEQRTIEFDSWIKKVFAK
jgi:Glycosyltransferase